MAMPSARNRGYGLQVYKYGIEGILHWGFNFYNSDYSRWSIILEKMLSLSFWKRIYPKSNAYFMGVRNKINRMIKKYI